MRLRSGLSFIVVFLAFPLHAQFVGKVDVSLVNVDVTVTSRGAPARGLTRDDFEVLEDGVPQPIANFYAVENSPRGVDGSDTDQPSGDRFRRHVLVIVDMNHTSRHNRNVALTQLERFVDEHFNSGEYDWSIAVATRKIHLVLRSTSDKAEIHNAMSEVRQMAARGLLLNRDIAVPTREQSAAEANAALWEESYNARDSVDALVQAIRAFTNVRGKKIILLLTGGLGSSADISLIPFDAPGLSTDTVVRVTDAGKIGTRLRDVLVREANTANVSFYILNPEGLTAPGNINGPPMTNNSMSFWIAEQTGGRMLPGNDPKLSLQEFDRVSANFYSLAYRPPHGDDGQYHRIEVRLKRRGSYSLQYRNGYVAAAGEAQLMRSLASPLAVSMQSSAFPLTLTTGAPRREGEGVVLPVTVEVPYKVLQSVPGQAGWSAAVDVFISLFDANGVHIVTSRFPVAAVSPTEFSKSDAVLSATKEVRLAAGKAHRIVVAVRDPLSEAVGIASREVR